MRYSQAFERDWKFYLDHRHKFTFFGGVVERVAHDPNGLPAKKCFYAFDSRGELPCTSEPELLTEVITAKKAVNWQIKQWGEGFHDMMEPVEYYLAEFTNPPEWVRLSLERAKQKAGRERYYKEKLSRDQTRR